MASYVVAAKRGSAPAAAGCNWQELFAGIPGVKVQGSNPRRVQIEAPKEAVTKLRRQLGDDFRIEPLISHRTARCA